MPWDIPYLPVDPGDVGRTFETVVRINSQSGKGGVAYVISSLLGLNLPRDLQVEFAATVQERADAEGGEIGPDRIRKLFIREYVSRSLVSVPLPPATGIPACLHVDGAAFEVGAARADEVERMCAGLELWGVDVRAVHRTRTALAGCGGLAVYAELRSGDRVHWGVGVDEELESAVSAAVRSAVARMNRTTAPVLAEPFTPRYARAG